MKAMDLGKTQDDVSNVSGASLRIPQVYIKLPFKGGTLTECLDFLSEQDKNSIEFDGEHIQGSVVTILNVLQDPIIRGCDAVKALRWDLCTRYLSVLGRYRQDLPLSFIEGQRHQYVISDICDSGHDNLSESGYYSINCTEPIVFRAKDWTPAGWSALLKLCGLHGQGISRISLNVQNIEVQVEYR